ncbi:MAG TPA: hypothetical protein VNJ54_08490 [Plantibacter sp.]|uniref:hypothetical protein n=1 Tax=Plantibacter sp. TaxID=1871045 RepID=UPI002B8C9C16|nr:hypothetical protein [Plantibacter sp.]
MTQPMLVFAHIPKTAGTTLTGVIEREYGVAACVHVKNWHDHRDESLEAIRGAAANPFTRAVLGHLPFAARPAFPPTTRWLTVLRDPVERALSDYFYGKRVGAVPLAEYLARTNNLQTRMLSGIDPTESAPAEELLEGAKRNLRDPTTTVALAERFDESLALCTLRFGWRGVLYRSVRVNDQRPTLEQIGELDETAILRENEVDLELYRYAELLFAAAVAESGAAIAFELRALELAEERYGARRSPSTGKEGYVGQLPLLDDPDGRALGSDASALEARVEQIGLASALGSERIRTSRIAQELATANLRVERVEGERDGLLGKNAALLENKARLKERIARINHRRNRDVANTEPPDSGPTIPEAARPT